MLAAVELELHQSQLVVVSGCWEPDWFLLHQYQC